MHAQKSSLSDSNDATQLCLAFLSQPEIVLGDAEQIELLLADSQLLHSACEKQLFKITHLNDAEIAQLRAALPAANWEEITSQLNARLQNADKFFEDDAEEMRQINA